MSAAVSAGRDDVAIFLDFDGTLVDIAERPDAVRVEPDMPDVLRRLRERLAGAVAIISGRTIAELDHFLRWQGLDACGMHGLERRISGSVSLPAGLVEIGPQIDALRRTFADRPGILVEDKRVGVALHWRMMPEAEAEAMGAMARLADELGPGYRIQDGKSVREIVPAASGKGGAVRELMAREPYRGRMPVFAGDDRTDEHGFEAADALGGIGIKLGSGATMAARRSPDAGAFREWLRRFAEGSSDIDDLPRA